MRKKVENVLFTLYIICRGLYESYFFFVVNIIIIIDKNLGIIYNVHENFIIS